MPLSSDGDPAGAAPLSWGQVPSRFQIEKALGQGGMGEVLLARDTLLNRRVALKRLLPQGDDRARQRGAILREARRASQINDRHIAAIYDVLDLDDQVILVMEYVDGMTLRERMRQPVSLDAFWDLAPQCAEGLAAAHAHGVIHRDIKPENLMVTREGVVKVLDFGVAKRADGVGPTTTTTAVSAAGNIAGTPQYMAPEAHLGEAVDERTDLFALGAVFYEMLTANAPFEGTTYGAVIGRVLNTEPPPVSQLNPAVSPRLSALISAMLAKKPEARIATSADLMRELTLVRGAGMEPAPPAAEPARTPPPTAPARATTARGLQRVAMVSAIVAAITAAVLSRGWWGAPALPRDINVALLAPATAPLNDNVAFALGATDVVARRLNRLSAARGFQMAPFWKVVDDSIQTPSEARKALGVNLVLIPGLEQQPDAYHLRLDLIEPVKGRRIASRSVTIPASQPFEVLDQLYGAAASMLHRPVPGPGGPGEYGIRGAGTLRFYLQGLGRLRVARTTQDARRAITDLTSACQLEPESGMARAALAQAFLRDYQITHDADRLAAAEASAATAVALDSARAETHRARANVYSSKREQESALAEYLAAVRLDPTDDDSNLRLARTYFRMGQPERERDTYLEEIARRPHCWPPWWWLATWYFRSGDVDASVGAFREMVRLAPDYAEAYSSLGGVLVQRGNYAQAIDTLKHSLELRPSQAAYDNLGTAYFHSKRFQEAVDAYNQAFQFGTADYVTWFNLGDAYSWLQGRERDAAGAYAQSITLGRDEIASRAATGRSVDIRIPANLAVIFARIGEPDSARRYLAIAIAADSASSMVQYCAALTCWQLGEKDRAMTWLEQSVHAGYPLAWLRDSPIFDDWRALPRFRALTGGAGPVPQRAASGS